ncbi:MAG: hypothetical protein ACLQVM_10970 [Terriglobia bacterium]
MHRINAYHYIQAAELLAQIQDRIDLGWFNSTDSISVETIQWISGTLPSLATHCESLDLNTTHTLITNFLNGYEVFAQNPTPTGFIIQRGVQIPVLTSPTRQDAAIQIKCIKSTFEAELQSKLFTFILPHRAGYFSDEQFGTEISAILAQMGAFPNAKFDLVEAGNCYAAGRFTAAVYHLMRAAEHGLVAVATVVGVPEDKRTSWNKLIQGIESETKRMVSSATKPSDWKEREKRYGDLCSWFTAIQKGWRNPVSHIPRSYSEHAVRGMFSVINSLFAHLSEYGIRQCEMPGTLISLPDQES